MLSLKKSCQRILSLTVVILLVITALNFLYAFLNQKQHNSVKFQEATNSNWVLVYFDAQLEDYYQDREKAASLKKEFANLKSPQYFEIHGQPIEVADFMGPTNALNSFDFDGGSSSSYSDYRENIQYGISSVKALQISENTQNRFQFRTQSGSILNAAAFEFRKGESIHVLLGSDYIGKYKTGDQFTGWYLFQKFEFIVDGILATDTFIRSGYDTIDLSAMLVMPNFNIVDAPQNSNEQIFFVRHYASKLSGSYEYTTAADANAFMEKCQLLSKGKGFSYETNDIALTIEDALLFAPFDTRYFDVYSALMVVMVILCVLLLVALFLLSTNQVHAHEVTSRTALARRFIEFLISVCLASVAVYVVCRSINLHFSLFVFVSSGLALMISTVLFVRRRHILKRM